jgi:glyceraldehyde-3-phosphate dehydrogenase (ferredoxin)
MGSRLLQYHNIVGCVFGGGWEDPDLRDSAEIDTYFLEHFGKKTIQADLAVTTKYRYAPEFETGGTFGVNMRNLDGRIMSFNYQSIYASEDERERQHEDFVLKHYLAQFNEEIIAQELPALRRAVPRCVQEIQRQLQERLRDLSRAGAPGRRL